MEGSIAFTTYAYRRFLYKMQAGECARIFLNIISNANIYFDRIFYTSGDSVSCEGISELNDPNWDSTATIDNSKFGYAFANDTVYNQNLILQIAADDGCPARFSLEVIKTQTGTDNPHPLVYSLYPVVLNVDAYGMRFNDLNNRLYVLYRYILCSMTSGGTDVKQLCTTPDYMRDIDFDLDGNIWACDANNGYVYKVINGTLTQVANTGFSYCTGILRYTDNNFYVLGVNEEDNYPTIAQVTSSGQVDIIYTGTSTCGGVSGLELLDDWIYFSEQTRIMRFKPGSQPECVVGDLSGTAAIDGSFAEAKFANIQDLAIDPDNRIIYVADSDANAIRVVNLQSATVSTLDVTLLGAISLDWYNGHLYCNSNDQTIYKVILTD